MKNEGQAFIWKDKEETVVKDGVTTKVITQVRVRNPDYKKGLESDDPLDHHSNWTSSKKHPRPAGGYDPHWHKQKYIKWRNDFLFGNRMTEREAKFYLRRYPDIEKDVGKDNYKGAIKHWRTQGRKEKRNKLAYDELTDDEAKCYLKRYPDVSSLAKDQPSELAFARKHYFMWGFFEHRNRYCADRITDIQAECYLRRYPDLQQKYKFDIRSAKRHYYKRGYLEGRNYTCPDSTGPKKCANYGDDCRC